ncbi:MAG: serine protease [Candidatus Thiodiazotropha sp. (ex Monitilora ramsayi)]|nr:serine protease [Candidatus Thiodiazotropha sp. (ex Monitilora ramsayi)]
MKTIVVLIVLGAMIYAALEYNLDWHVNKEPVYELHAKRIPKDSEYLKKYFVQSCSGPYCNYTFEWKGGGVAGFEVSNNATSGTGTATAIDNKGHWLTARHVVDGCSRIKLRSGQGEEVYVKKARLHPEKDLALLFTKPVDIPYLKIANSSPSRYANGYVTGFPMGGSGVLYMNLLGSNKYRHTNADAEEYTLIWAIEQGLDAYQGKFFGFSGSSILNKKGEIISVMQGYGSAYVGQTATATSTLASIHELIDGTINIDEIQDNAMQMKLTDDNFFRVGRKLRKQYTVALVTCETD